MDNHTISGIIATLICLPIYIIFAWAMCCFMEKVVGNKDRWWKGFFWGNIFLGQIMSDIRMIIHHCGN